MFNNGITNNCATVATEKVRWKFENAHRLWIIRGWMTQHFVNVVRDKLGKCTSERNVRIQTSLTVIMTSQRFCCTCVRNYTAAQFASSILINNTVSSANHCQSIDMLGTLPVCMRDSLHAHHKFGHLRFFDLARVFQLFIPRSRLRFVAHITPRTLVSRTCFCCHIYVMLSM